MFRAVCSNFLRISAESSMKRYWFTIWLHVSRMPIGAAKDRRQSLRSVESRSYRQSVDTFDGRSSGSESV